MSNSEQADAGVNVARLRWQCRRGIKEVEVLIIPFFEQKFAQLTGKNQKVFAKLLEATDADLFAWFMGHETSEDLELVKMIEHIKHAVQPEF